MKKFWMLAVVLIIAISISACGNKAPVEEQKQVEEAQQKEETQEEKPQESVEPAEEDVETSNSETQKSPNSDGQENSAESSSSEDVAYRIPNFKSQDFEGNEVTNEYFADNKLTVVNIWTTT